MVNQKVISGLVIVLLSVAQSPGAFGAAKAGAKCTKSGAKETVKGVVLTCLKSGSRLVWTQPKASAPKETVNQSNARKKAASYLSYSSFSRSGLTFAQIQGR